ncbi:MAG: hypothetical protein U9N30_02030 [Campylobacterota bacterium]|nr:hypothetical protein [Campylobacterota bacterium]
MKLYIYAQSGHTFGLEKVRKASVIAKKLKKYDPTLATADYRAASYAKEYLGVEKGVGVDVLTNLPHMMTRNDFLVYDSNEASDFTKDHMNDFCSLLYEVGDNLTSIIVDDFYRELEKNNHSIEKLFFYGDDDYADALLKQAQDENAQYSVPVLVGHYMFLGNEDKLAKNFTNVIEEEGYNETIKEAKYCLSGSEQTVLEVLANNANPILLIREDKNYQHLDLFTQCGIPTITKEDKTLETIFEEFNSICANYPSIKRDIFTQFDEQIENILKELSSFDRLIELTRGHVLPQDMNN